MSLIHKEGYKMLLITAALLLLLNVGIQMIWPSALTFFIVLSVVFFGIILQFFRNPKRSIEVQDDHIVYAPADGKVVVIEETVETEYFKDKRIQVSVFMSPINVHVNRNPMGGLIRYFRYHPGKYLVAWHPKSSTENERTTVVIANNHGEILLRQVAGALAKRIINYLKEGDTVAQGSEMGFIKFGSRVDIYLPLDAKILVEKEQVVKGNKTLIARL